MTVDINLLKQRVQVRADSFEGASGWTWISDNNDATWDVIGRDWQEHHKPTILNAFPNGGRTAIMAGGNCGLYPAVLSQYFNAVYTFEPDPIHFHCLANNCQFPNIFKFQAALGAKPGMAAISQQFQGNTGMTQVAGVEQDAIPVLTVDSFQFHELDLLFLDTEGFEADILEGAKETLQRCWPKLILELSDVDKGEFLNFNKCVGILTDLGYTNVTRIGRLDYLIEKE